MRRENLSAILMITINDEEIIEPVCFEEAKVALRFETSSGKQIAVHLEKPKLMKKEDWQEMIKNLQTIKDYDDNWLMLYTHEVDDIEIEEDIEIIAKYLKNYVIEEKLWD